MTEVKSLINQQQQLGGMEKVSFNNEKGPPFQLSQIIKNNNIATNSHIWDVKKKNHAYL